MLHIALQTHTFIGIWHLPCHCIRALWHAGRDGPWLWKYSRLRSRAGRGVRNFYFSDREGIGQTNERVLAPVHIRSWKKYHSLTHIRIFRVFKLSDHLRLHLQAVRFRANKCHALRSITMSCRASVLLLNKKLHCVNTLQQRRTSSCTIITCHVTRQTLIKLYIVHSALMHKHSTGWCKNEHLWYVICHKVCE